MESEFKQMIESEYWTEATQGSGLIILAHSFKTVNARLSSWEFLDELALAWKAYMDIRPELIGGEQTVRPSPAAHQEGVLCKAEVECCITFW